VISTPVSIVAALAAVLHSTLQGQALDATQVLTATREALGGEKKLSAVRSFTATGYLPQRGVNLTQSRSNPANYTPLSPVSLIARTAYTYPHHLAVVHGDRRYTWAETYVRSRRLASALAKAGIGVGDTVALMASIAGQHISMPEIWPRRGPFFGSFHRPA
jgi:non-ribosomal peptide synthetase component F